MVIFTRSIADVVRIIRFQEGKGSIVQSISNEADVIRVDYPREDRRTAEITCKTVSIKQDAAMRL